MRIEPQFTDVAALAELGRRLARIRIGRNITQAELAFEAGLSRTTIVRLESGGAVTTPALLRVLRALGLLDRLDLLVPEASVNPIDLLERQGRQRRRARRSRSSDAAPGPWSWGTTGEAPTGSPPTDAPPPGA